MALESENLALNLGFLSQGGLEGRIESLLFSHGGLLERENLVRFVVFVQNAIYTQKFLVWVTESLDLFAV